MVMVTQEVILVLELQAFGTPSTKEELIWLKENQRLIDSSPFWLITQGKIDEFLKRASETAGKWWLRHAMDLLDLKSVSEDGRFLRSGQLPFSNPMGCKSVPTKPTWTRTIACQECGAGKDWMFKGTTSRHLDLVYVAGESVAGVLEAGREIMESEVRCTLAVLPTLMSSPPHPGWWVDTTKQIQEKYGNGDMNEPFDPVKHLLVKDPVQ